MSVCGGLPSTGQDSPGFPQLLHGGGAGCVPTNRLHSTVSHCSDLVSGEFAVEVL